MALRVQSRDDSNKRHRRAGGPRPSAGPSGGAYVKLGQDDISPVQTALVTGRCGAQMSQLVDLHPVHFGQDVQRDSGTTTRDDDATDLDLLIDAIVEANADSASPRPAGVARGAR